VKGWGKCGLLNAFEKPIQGEALESNAYIFLYFLRGIFMKKKVLSKYDPRGNFSKCFMCKSILHMLYM